MNLIFYMETMASVAPGDAADLQPQSQAGPAEDQDYFSNSVTGPLGPAAPRGWPPRALGAMDQQKRSLAKGPGAYQAVSSKTKKI